MRHVQGFTLLELVMGLAALGVLASLSYAGYEASWEKSNFRNMQEFGVELALNQQLHRQRFGRYATSVADNGTPSATTLIMPSAGKYQVRIALADFRRYNAEVSPHAEDRKRLPDSCRTLLVYSDTGHQRFGARSLDNRNTTSQCIPHG